MKASPVHTVVTVSLAWGFALLFVVILAPGPLNAQVCTGDIRLTTQAEVDAFNCSEVTGL